MIKDNIQSRFNSLRSVYFIGIGGIGVSALALWCLKNKIKVFGYDREQTEITSNLQYKGVTVFYEHESVSKKNSKHHNVLKSFKGKNSSIVVFSSAVNKNHPIRKYFDINFVKCIKRAEFLGLISNNYKVIAISGTHGKTTISTMLTHILKVGGVDCSAFLGGISKNYLSNFVDGDDNIMVIEADEYDKSFFYLKPNIILISSLDRDHSDTYPTFSEMKAAYKHFVYKNRAKLSEVILKKDIQINFPELKYIFEYSIIGNADFSLNYKKNNLGDYTISIIERKKNSNKLKKFTEINVPFQPEHNLENFLAASTIALRLGLSINNISLGINTFLGVKRRFEYHIRSKNQIFIEDYAHHPSEINSLIISIRKMYKSKKITMIFQPHLYSRTKDFLHDFASVLSKVDSLILLDIYPARELPIKNFNINNLYNLIKIDDKIFVSNENLVSHISKTKPKFLVSVGAGDVSIYSKKIKEVLV